MRNLNLNLTKLWKVESSGLTDLKDSDGNYTGERIKAYSTPTQIALNIYPSNGTIAEQIFGKDASFDMVAVSNTVVLGKDTLLFLTQPTSNYDTTYDYSVSKINKSKNTYNYGLKGRV